MIYNIFSILKYETVANGANRKLIVKNIRRQDVGEYSAKSGESKVTVKLTVGAQSASGSTLTGKYFMLTKINILCRADWQFLTS